MIYSDAEVEEFLRTGEQEAELRKQFGDAEYNELTALARDMGHKPQVHESHRGDVFILPGIMGSQLSVLKNGVQDPVWIDPSDIALGGLKKLKMGAASVAATAVILSPYQKMKMRLKRAGYNVKYMAYDWRLSPEASGKALIDWIRRKGMTNVSLVCHSMGGLVAREMAAQDSDKTLISRVITVGTPNYGSYSPVEIFALTHSMLKMVAAVDIRHTRREIAHDILRNFPGLLQMMPAPSKRPDESFFSTSGWPKGTVKPTKAALDAAKAAVSKLPKPDDRFIQIVGWAEKTIVNARKASQGFVYTKAYDGDGTVPRALAEVKGVQRYYTKGAHGDLCKRSDVIEATLDLLKSSKTSKLPETLPLRTAEATLHEENSIDLAKQETPAMDLSSVSDADFAGDFLATKQKQPAAASVLISQATQPRKTDGAYPAPLMAAARKRWEESQAEREDVERKIEQAAPLAAETQERLKAYTRRLKSQVDSVETGSGAEIAQNLGRALKLTESMGPVMEHMPQPNKAFLERVIGEAEEFLSVMFFKRAVIAARAVGRIVTNHSHSGFGTGFLIAPNVLMTNNHVLSTVQNAAASSIQFQYELHADSRQSDGFTFRLVPERLFYTDEKLDMSLIAVSPFALDGTPIKEFGYLPLISAEGKIRKGQHVNIIQHPNGGRKQVVFRKSTLNALPEKSDYVAHYTGDTKPGSSGSPVFSDRWEVVALHHSGVPETNSDGKFITINDTVWDPRNDPQAQTIKWVANEGIRISRIVRHLNDVPAFLDATGQPGTDLVREILKISANASREPATSFTSPPPVIA